MQRYARHQQATHVLLTSAGSLKYAEGGRSTEPAAFNARTQKSHTSLFMIATQHSASPSDVTARTHGSLATRLEQLAGEVPGLFIQVSRHPGSRPLARHELLPSSNCFAVLPQGCCLLMGLKFVTSFAGCEAAVRCGGRSAVAHVSLQVRTRALRRAA